MSERRIIIAASALSAIIFGTGLIDGLIGLSTLGLIICAASIAMGLIGLAASIAMIHAALSLKRIEGLLKGDGDTILTRPINAYGEPIGEAIQGQIERGMRGISPHEGK